MPVKVSQIDESTWEFNEEGVRFFLLAGTEKALLIDSGMMTKNAKELAEEKTSLPLFLLNTHADRDHIGSNDEFESFYMNPAECSNYYHGNRGRGTIVPVWDGDVLDLGNRPLLIIAIPGHTPGSVAVLDEKNRRIFTGDPVQDGKIFMFGVQREMHAYRHSLLRLQKFADRFDEIYPSHGTCPVRPGLIMELYEASGRVLAGEIPGCRAKMFGKPVMAYDAKAATFLCDAAEE